MDALLTTVAVSNNQTVRTPYETLVFGSSEEIIEGVTSLKVPESIAQKMTRTRKQVCRLLEGVQGLEKMQKTLAPHIKGILQVYPQFDLDWHWLKHHAKECLVNRAHDSILDKFPRAGAPDVSEKQVLASLQALSMLLT